jgi:CO/xanthine dehydrogenase Mo-binding subunit
MNRHVKVIPQTTDLSRRSFLVDTAAAGLVLGFAGVPGIDQAFAASASFEPSVWYAISPDGLVTVTCGKADMGQHIASTMAQIIAEELGANWKDMRVQLASNDPKFNDPVLGAQITGGSWSTMMNFDAMSRAGAAGRMALTEAAAAANGRAGERASRARFHDQPSEVEETDELCRHRQEREGQQDLHAGRAQGDRAEVSR